jgi:Heavy metal associated domain 2
VTLPEAYISHSIPHRLRIKIPSKKGDTSFLASAKDAFVRLEGIEHVEINEVTGSILLLHTLSSGKIAEYAEGQHLFMIEGLKTYHKQTFVSRKISETFLDLNKKVTVSTKGFANIPDLAVLTLLGLSVLQISRGNFMAPAWYAAMWYALNIFLKSQPSEGAAAE